MIGCLVRFLSRIELYVTCLGVLTYNVYSSRLLSKVIIMFYNSSTDPTNRLARQRPNVKAVIKPRSITLCPARRLAS